MIYLKYSILAFCQLICMAICYLTNPLVVLFADKDGELPAFLKLWQTWDSALDNRQYVLYDCPKWLSYDFDEYYDTAVMTIGHGRSKRIVLAKKRFQNACG